MTTFAQQLNGWTEKVEFRTREMFTQTVSEIERSVKFGSEITGAPGQPVDTGFLRNSWGPIWVGPNNVVIGTNVEYARPIEDGTSRGRAMKLRSAVGGFHSVKITMSAVDRIMKYIVRKFGWDK